ncbi:MAG: fenitrothion hydrolase, partial [Acidimicrobiia bacterium]|nr:fenitrothion hydrolase [Acidimicrobiia bacterium]
MIRRSGFVALVAVLIAGIPAPALAHGIGGRADLPVPVEFFLYGAGVVLVLSFIALAVLWPEPRLQDGPRFRPVTSQPIGGPAGVLATIGVVGLVLVVVAGLFGVQNSSRNVAPVLVWVTF